jgi:hypothetical protein
MREFGGQPVVPFQDSMRGLQCWDTQIIGNLLSDAADYMGNLLRERRMDLGFTVAAQNLQSQVQGNLEILNNLRRERLSPTTIRNSMASALGRMRTTWENFFIQLGNSPDLPDTIIHALEGVPSSSGGAQTIGEQQTRQRQQPSSPPTQTAAPPPTPTQLPAEQGYGWMYHMKHVLKYIWDNKVYIGAGLGIGLATGGVGALAGVVSMTTGLVGGAVLGGSIVAGGLAGKQCQRCQRGECSPQQHEHQD